MYRFFLILPHKLPPRRKKHLILQFGVSFMVLPNSIEAEMFRKIMEALPMLAE